MRCPVCSGLFEEKTIVDEVSCPRCGTGVTPEYPDLDVTLTINWDALRLLANWALNWAKAEYPKDHVAHQEIETVFAHLRRYRPEEGEPLTLDDALAYLKTLGINIEDPDNAAGDKIEVQFIQKKRSSFIN